MERRIILASFVKCCTSVLLLAMPSIACAQRADENVITSAEDAFGTAVSGETIGLYDATTVRGFSPSTAGNLRIEGLYFDQQADMTIRVQSGYAVHIGTGAQGYIFPAPTGIVDYSLRRSDNKNLFSTVATVDSEASTRLEVDSQLSIIDNQLSSAVGMSISNNHFSAGGSDRRKAFGVVPRWRIGKNVEITAFWGRYYSMDETAPPIYLPRPGQETPAVIQRDFYPGPAWAQSNIIGDNSGVLALASLGEWTVRAGVFNSLRRSSSSYANLFLNTTPEGFGDHVIIADPPQHAASTSGEVRISRGFDQGKLKHLILGSLRWRNVNLLYDGSDSYDAGIANLNDPLLIAKPVFNFSDRSLQHVTQQTTGIAYNLHWEQVGDLGVGIQHVDYSKFDMQARMASTRLNTNPWLQDLTLSLNIVPTLVAYGSYSRGLEDNGNAPDSAANRNQPLPAIKSRQYDFGLRWSPTEHTNLIVGYFDITKPYVTADNHDIYRLLGDEIHRGMEVSLNIMPTDGLTVIAGGVFMDPEIKHTQDAGEVIGGLPVNQPRNTVQLNVDYVLPFAHKVSVNIGVNKWSSVATTVDNHVHLSSPMLVTAGGRYKFKVGNTPCTARMLVTNTTNQYYWYLVGSGAFQPSYHTLATVSFTADF